MEHNPHLGAALPATAPYCAGAAVIGCAVVRTWRSRFRRGLLWVGLGFGVGGDRVRVAASYERALTINTATLDLRSSEKVSP
jgi:hypothetical protein